MRGIWVVVAISTMLFPQIGNTKCIQGNCYDGLGTYIYPSGAKYIGKFQKGQIHGNGTLYFSNGNVYKGDWVWQYRQGRGKMIFRSGEVYTGEFHKSKMSGRGTMKFPDGDKYTGQWANDVQHGKGTYWYANGNRYEGQFRAGKLHGYGSMFYKDGSRYAGDWKSNKKDGKGRYYKVDGTSIAGTWHSGKFLGENSSSLASNGGRDTQGGYAENKPSTNSSLPNCNSSPCKEGMGIFTYGDGSKWIGEMSDGSPDGEGTCYYVNGDKYVGGWSNHAPHGEGIMYYSSGRVLGAQWNNGRTVRELDGRDQPVLVNDVSVEDDPDVKIWAVVVGVARYAHMPTLKFTDDDAYQIYAFLKSPAGGALKDDQIRVLIDEEASRKGILKAMRETFLKADENDVVVMYFSGHGLPGAFLPSDFDGFNNRLKHEDVQKIFKESKAKHKLCLADACHSGTMLAARTPLDGILRDYYKAFEQSNGGTALILSSKGDEYSLEDHGLRQGIFSHFLIRGLRGEADKNKNGIVTVQELFGFVDVKVRTYTGNVQNPKLSGVFDPQMPVSVVH